MIGLGGGKLGLAAFAACVAAVSAEYNLIKNPAYCQNRTTSYQLDNETYTTRICPMFGAGTFDGVFPNPTEKKILLDANIARLFPAEFSAEHGNFVYASNGDPLNPATCGLTQDHPYWWSPSTTEMARFQSFTCRQCSQQCANGGHKTCVDVAHYITGPRKNFFGWNRQFINSEAICPNIVTCMAQDIGHCGMFFNSGRTLLGPGYGNLPGQGSGFVVNGLQTNSPAPERHPLPVGVHYLGGGKLKFRAVFYGDDKYNAQAGYVYYYGERHTMNLVYGDSSIGIYEWETDNYSLGDCQSYFFSFETDRYDAVNECQATVRLPENPNLFFGTSFQPTGNNDVCLENHYYLHDDQTTVTLHDTPTWQNPTVLPCLGCDTVELLLTEAALLGDNCPQIDALAILDYPSQRYRDSGYGKLPEDSLTEAPLSSPTDSPVIESFGFFARVRFAANRADVYEFTYSAADNSLESFGEAESVSDSVKTGNKFQAVAAEGDTVCFVATDGTLYCNGMDTNLGAVSVDVYNSYVYTIQNDATLHHDVLEIAAIPADDSIFDLSLNSIQIPTPLHPLGAIAAGSLKTCVIQRTNDFMFCVDGDLVSNPGAIFTQVLGTYRDVVIRDNHVFAITTGADRKIVYKDANDLFDNTVDWQTFHQDKWVTFDFDPATQHLCAYKKKYNIYCFSGVDPGRGSTWVTDAVMTKMDTAKKPTQELVMKRIT